MYVKPKATVEIEHRSFGLKGASRFMLLCVFFSAPESYAAWVWSRSHHDWFIFGLISFSYMLLFVIFLSIARPWQKIL